MTKEMEYTMTTQQTAKVGLVRQAYTGAPRGIAQVSLVNPELRTRQLRWELKSKRLRRQEVIDTI